MGKVPVNKFVKPMRSHVCGNACVNAGGTKVYQRESNSTRICSHTSRGIRCATCKFVELKAASRVASGWPRRGTRREEKAGGGETTRWRWRHEFRALRLKCHWRKRAAGMLLRRKPYFVKRHTIALRRRAWSCRCDHVRSWIVLDLDLPSVRLRFFTPKAQLTSLKNCQKYL